MKDIDAQLAEKDMLLSLAKDIARIKAKDELMNLIKEKFRGLFYFNHATIVVLHEDGVSYGAYLLDPASQTRLHPRYGELINGSWPVADGFVDVTLEAGGPVVFDLDELEEVGALPYHIRIIQQSGLRHMMNVALVYDGRAIGVMAIYADRPEGFSPSIFPLVTAIAGLVSLAVVNIRFMEASAKQLVEISRYKEQLEEEKMYLQQEAGKGAHYSDIIGSGPGMQQVFHLLSQVSFANSTVLIQGETGTGKELVARAIHNSSQRKDKLMVRVNCAALPVNLIESELFGHEKGSFTGATERRIGKFELANNGSLFLDEIGEMSLDMQVKLLRAIQEKEIERLGGKGPIKVNVRIIAATNRNLQKEVNEGRFRQDLFYRLNVFPINMPPLRERKEDIPGLVAAFADKFSKNTGKKILHVSGKAMKALMAYDWPGNVRELEHLVERCVLLTKGDTIRDVYLPGTQRIGRVGGLAGEDGIKTLQENERDHILRALKKCRGKIYGPGGAAELLGINSSTLNSRIRKLGITIGKRFYKRE